MNPRSPILFTKVTLIAAVAIWFTVQLVSAPNIARAQVDVSCDNVSDIPLAECEALVAIYENDSYLRAESNWFSSSLACTWASVTCTNGRVTKLVLAINYGGFPRINSDDGHAALAPASVSLHTLPPEIGNLTELTYLDLNYNYLTILPTEIGNLTKLTYLDLNGNKLTELPPEIGNLTALTELKLWSNALTSLPSEIGDLTALTDLQIGGNMLTSLPAEIGTLTSLTRFGLGGNAFTSLPREMGALTSLAEISLHNNQVDLMGLPDEIGDISLEIRQQLTDQGYSFEHANFTCATVAVAEIAQSECDALVAIYRANSSRPFGWLINTTPCAWANVDCTDGHVVRLSLREKNLTNLPAEMGAFPLLKSINLADNALTSLPPEIGNLMALEAIDLGGNVLTSLPPEMGNLSALTWLNLQGNGNTLMSLPVEIGTISAELRQDLIYQGFPFDQPDFSCTNVSDIPQIECDAIMAIYNANAQVLPGWRTTAPLCYWNGLSCTDGHVTELDLGYSRLTDIPAAVGNLMALTSLNVSGNELTTLPAEIGNLSSLTDLALDENILASLPPEIGNLNLLVDLGLSNNELTSVPPEIGNLTLLDTLTLSNNKLVSLPKGIGNLTELRNLYLDYNELAIVPPEIGNLTNLTWLQLHHNRLTSVPAEIGKLTKLFDLGLSDNLLTGIPAEIIDLAPSTFINLSGNGGTVVLPPVLNQLNTIYMPAFVR